MAENFSHLEFHGFSTSTQLMRDSALLRATTELFLQEETHSPDEVRRYEELTAHLLPKVGEEDRGFLAERLANRADAPQAVVRMLAKDKIGVARAVLGASPVLGALDLLSIIATTGGEHHRIIASRRGLTAEVRQALRISADRALAATLDEIEAANNAPSLPTPRVLAAPPPPPAAGVIPPLPGPMPSPLASIPPPVAPLPAVAAPPPAEPRPADSPLAAAARVSPEAPPPTPETRRPAPASAEPPAADPLPSVPPLRSQPPWAISRDAVAARTPGRFDPWLFLASDRPARLRLMAELATRPPVRRYGGPTGRIDRAFRAILSAAQIVGLARSGDRRALIDAIADSLELDLDLVVACLDDATGEPLAVLLKSLGLDNIQAQQLFLLATPQIGRDVNRFFKICDVYAGMEPAVAETLGEAWRESRVSRGPRHVPHFAENSDRPRPGEAARPAAAPASERKTFGSSGSG